MPGTAFVFCTSFLLALLAIPLQMNSQTASRMLKHGTLHIALQMKPVEIAASSWRSNYSVELTRAIKRGNLPSRISIAFDQKRYLKVQEDRQWGWWGKSTELFDLSTEKGWFCKEHPLMNARTAFSPGQPGDFEEVDEPVVELLEERKEISGQTCRKARWMSEEGAWTLWYAEGVQMPEQLEFIWGLPGIPGVIMEMVESPGPGQVSVRHYTVESLDESPLSEHALTPPEGYKAFNSSTEARRAVLELQQKDVAGENPTFGSLKGPWKLTGAQDELFLKVEKREGQTVLVKELGAGEARVSPILMGENRFLLVEGLEFKLYRYDKKAKVLEQVGQSAFRFEKAKGKEVREAGIDFE